MKDYVVGGIHVATIGEIADQIKIAGFNCVRLQWSLEMYWNNPVVGEDAIVAMPQLKGKSALEVYDLVSQRSSFSFFFLSYLILSDLIFSPDHIFLSYLI